MHSTPARIALAVARPAGIVAVALVVACAWPPSAVRAQGYDQGPQQALGPLYREAPGAQRGATRPPHEMSPRGMVRHWNELAIDASGLDHTPVAAGEARVYGEQLGPARASRAMAIVHIAVFEAVNAVMGRYQSYVGLPEAAPGTSLEVAIAQAAHDALAAQLAQDLAAVRGTRAKDLGIVLGQRAAAPILALRVHDGSAHAEPRFGVDYAPSPGPGKWRQDPVSMGPLALGARWDEVEPFVMAGSAQFRAPPPPALDSAAYAQAYAEVKAVGGDGITTPTGRNVEQATIGLFWAYDGMPSLCAPPRLYNQIAMQIATSRGSDAAELARLLALVNIAMADAAIAIWVSKYHYELWRPVTGIREDDRNPMTAADPSFTPLGAPASNLTGPNFTPPFPAYPSGHAGFGGALFQTLRRYFGTDRIAFTFVSDEFNGVTQDHDGNVRPRIARSFRTLSRGGGERQSRIYLGIHWGFDKTEGIAQGRRVADLVFDTAFLPLH